MSRATFYKVFPGGLDEAVIAVIDRGLERVGMLALQAFESEASWQDGMRVALAAVLAFFDSEPDLARVCMVQTLVGSPVVLEHRARAVETFRGLVVARIETEVSGVSPLADEGVLASVMEIVRVRLSETEPQPLIDLLGPLMALIVEHVADRDMATKESHRAQELASAIRAGEIDWAPAAWQRAPGEIALPASIANPTARRLRECVRCLAKHPDISNRAVGAALHIHHKSQVSKLLCRLEVEGIAVKRSGSPGRPHEWRLTRYGEEVAAALIHI